MHSPKTSNLLVLYALLVALTVFSKLMWPSVWGVYAALKLLCTACIIVYAYRRGWTTSLTSLEGPSDSPLAHCAARRNALMLGLVMSWWGDLALLWPKEGFVLGLVAFLLAHLAFIYAFSRGVRMGAWPLAHAVYAVVGVVVLAILWPTIPEKLCWPVVAYVCCLVTMAGQTASWWHCATPNDRGALAAALGGLLFLLSDALLAFDKFYAPLDLRALWVSSTYWGALGLVAYSLKPLGQGAPESSHGSPANARRRPPRL